MLQNLIYLFEAFLCSLFFKVKIKENLEICTVFSCLLGKHKSPKRKLVYPNIIIQQARILLYCSIVCLMRLIDKLNNTIQVLCKFVPNLSSSLCTVYNRPTQRQ